jgi:hypothetical protein
MAFLRALNSRQVRLFEKCGVNFLNIGSLQPGYDKDQLFQIRHVLFYDFLKRFMRQFQRVLIVDLGDTFVQIDPFTTDFGYHTMSVTSELYTLNDDENNNTKWIRVADPDYDSHKSFYDDRVALNAGMMFGSMDGFLTFYNVFLAMPMYKNYEPKTLDQGYLNYMYYRGLFQVAGLNLSVTHPGDYLISVRGGQFHPKPNSDGLYVMRGTPVIPGVVHQYNRICPLLRGLRRTCGRVWYDKTPFPELKDASQDCSNTYMDKVWETATIDRVKEIAQKIHSRIPEILNRRGSKKRSPATKTR